MAGRREKAKLPYSPKVELLETMKLNGVEAVARGALESGVSVATGYPGGPITGIIESLARERREGIHVEWSSNEKEAVACAFGAAMVGKKSLVAIKHVGVNVASDAIMMTAFTGVKGALVIVAGADPGGIVSQNEMDDRYYAPLFMLPMLEPSTPQEALEITRYAFSLSDKYGIVVLLRFSSTFLKFSEEVRLGQLPEKEDSPDNLRFEPDKEHLSLGTYVLETNRNRHKRLTLAEEELSSSKFNRIEGNQKAILGIITAGPILKRVKEATKCTSKSFKILSLGVVYPFPRSIISEFTKSLERVLVVEEIEPYIEERIQDLNIPIRGKMTGDLPREGSLDQRDIEIGLRRFLGQDVSPRPLAIRSQEHIHANKRTRWAEGCPILSGHQALRQALNKMEDPICVGGVGVVSWGAGEPYKNLISTCCMGISPSVVSGMYHAGTSHQELIAVMGDSSFLHSGIQSLINAVYNKARITFLIFDNHKTAETGSQPNPGTGRTAMAQETVAISLEKLVQACGVKYFFKADPFDTSDCLNKIIKAVKEKEVSVVLLSASCPPICCADAKT